MTVAEAIRVLYADDSDNSCDEDEDSTSPAAMQVSSESFDSSDSDSDDASGPPDLGNFDGGQPLSNQWDTLQSRANVIWKRFSGTTNRGRAAAKNVFLERSGPTPSLTGASNREEESLECGALKEICCDAPTESTPAPLPASVVASAG